jgi:hypothetical protein
VDKLLSLTKYKKWQTTECKWGGGLGLKRLSDYIKDAVNNNNTIIILKKFVSHSKVLVSVQGLKNN